jgi:hypothetical protein
MSGGAPGIEKVTPDTVDPPRSECTTMMPASSTIAVRSWIGPSGICQKRRTRAAMRTGCPLFPAAIPHKGGLSPIRKKDFHDFIHPRIERRYLEDFLQRRRGTRILTP